MSRCLRITRRKHWADGHDESITRTEWREHIEKDVELRFDGADTARWIGYTTHECPLLSWRNGNIEVWEPDLELIRKMMSVAGALNAFVQGGDGEIYYIDGSSSPPSQRPAGLGSAWWTELKAIFTFRIDLRVVLVVGWTVVGFVGIGLLIAVLGAK